MSANGRAVLKPDAPAEAAEDGPAGSETPSLLQVLRRPLADAASVESVGLVAGAIVFVVGGVTTFLIADGRDLPISGPGSVGEIVAIGGAIVAAVVLVAVALLLRRREARLHGTVRPGRLRLHPLDAIALAVAHAIIALLAWTAIAAVVELSFIDAVVFPFSAALLAGVAMAVTAYAAFLSAAHLSATSLSLVLAVFLVVGMFASMLTASDPHWWQKNLSSLGITGDVSALAFNLTLIIAGVIVSAIAHAATVALPDGTRAERRGRASVRTSLVLIGVFLACVGIFKADVFFWVHTLVAVGMLVVFAVLVVRLPRTIPAMPRVFRLLGDVFLGVIAFLAVLYVTGYYNLTAVELVSAILIFSWIILFLRNTGAITSAPVQDVVEGSSVPATGVA
ncbi:MAG TPA: DUF998 domain-containing protein [Amnibacterium sp.]|uniref:DUF998 domain-containing protein n=1 Tax=Amnibacterium sp. TaxID=1872496 RepID=UPI002F94590A